MDTIPYRSEEHRQFVEIIHRAARNNAARPMYWGKIEIGPIEDINGWPGWSVDWPAGTLGSWDKGSHTMTQINEQGFDRYRNPNRNYGI